MKNMLKKLLLIFMTLVCINSIVAQFDDPLPPPPPIMTIMDCPETIHCLTEDVTILAATAPYGDYTESEVDNCGNVLIQTHYGFIVSSNELDLNITWETTDYFRMGLTTGCLPYGQCIGADENADGEIDLSFNDLVVGQEYIIYISGGLQEDIPFELEISIGSEDDFIAVTGIDVSYTNCTEGPTGIDEFCINGLLEWNIQFEDDINQNYFDQVDAEWSFTIDGPESYSFITDNLNENELQLETPGDYVICIDAVSMQCDDYTIGHCKEFTIVSIDLDYGEYSICQHEIEEGWVPDEYWKGEPIDEPGFYIFDYIIECGCPYNQSVEVIQLNEVVEEVEFVLCPDDYPFVYFDDYIFDYSQFDIIEDLEIFKESLQRDYDNDKCDSLVHLVLINEEPDNRCTTCELPVSLEKSKIVYCIPFDNEAVDASGKANRVDAIGISFDDNGSSDNILWEAVFDGNNDYVSLPHTDDLNTSVFSFNFRFNKDDPFENGDIETLMSKGDIANDNLRFEINLEKVNESIFDLVSTFYTPSGSVEIEMLDLQVFKWYDIAFVVETDSISLFLDGFLFEKIEVGENLKGNAENLYLGTIADNNRIQFYNGRLDNFKYWKQKLSGLDVLFLHLPEKEFEVDQFYFLSCCERAEFRDIVIDINNPLDSVIVPNASPTGYDSVYILNYIQADTGPELNTALAPQDMIVEYQKVCQEFCQATVNWTTDLSNLFSDNCGNVTVSQSHNFEVLLDENVSFVEVSIIGTDICGQSTTYSFGLELECLLSNVTTVPEENIFEVLVDDVCINDEDEICIYSQLQLQLGFVDQVTSTIQPYDSTSDFNAVVSINGVTQTLTASEVINGFTLSNFANIGIYEICLESVSNSCETLTNNYCQTIAIRESNIVDYGEVVACKDDIESALPSELSQGLRNLILNNPQETTISVTEDDACGCENTEKLSLVINDRVEEYLDVELCDGDNFDGRTENEMFIVELVAANGCDSLVYVDLIFLPKTEEVVFAEICEGESFEGYTEEGTYIEELSNIVGCDSMLTIQLSVLAKSYDDIFVEICPDSMYLEYNQTGIYEIFNTNTLGCDSITTLDLTVLDDMHPDCFVSSLSELPDYKITVFPNPVGEYLTLKTESGINGVLGYEIIDISGRLILCGKKLPLQLDVSEIKGGLLVLKLTLSDHTNKVVKFVKI